jgi:hypothetical protein
MAPTTPRLKRSAAAVDQGAAMQERPEPTRRIAFPGRTAWLACLALLLVLAIADVTAAHGESDSPATSAEPNLQLNDSEEEAATEEECVEEAEELEADSEEAEEVCAESDETESDAASGCPLRSAHAHAATPHHKLKVTVGYTSSEPVTAKIQIQAGARAETFTRHLGRSGVLRFTEKLGDRHGDQVVVRIQPTGASECSPRRLALFLPG